MSNKPGAEGSPVVFSDTSLAQKVYSHCTPQISMSMYIYVIFMNFYTNHREITSIEVPLCRETFTILCLNWRVLQHCDIIRISPHSTLMPISIPSLSNISYPDDQQQCSLWSKDILSQKMTDPMSTVYTLL